MGSKERRERERTDTRQRILDAARDMFVQHGYEATTMRALADRIEYTPTAIYHHFDSKEALMVELCSLDFRTLANAFNRIGRVEDPVERLARIGAAYVDFAIEHAMHYRLMFMTVRPPISPEMMGVVKSDPGEDAYEFLRLTCAEAIRSGRFRPEYDDPDEIAQMLWGATHGLVSLHIVRSHDARVQWRDIRATSSKLCDTILRGLTRG